MGVGNQFAVGKGLNQLVKSLDGFLIFPLVEKFQGRIINLSRSL